MSFQNHLTYNLNFLLQDLKITANTLSKETGIRQATVYKIKEGTISNPTIETLYPIAKYFGFTVDELMSVRLYSSTPMSEKTSRIPLISFSDIEKYPDINIIKYVNTDFPTSNDKYCVKAIEDNGKFENGSILIVDTSLQYQSRDYVIAKRIIDNKCSIKRIMYDDDFFLQSITYGLENQVFKFSDYSITGVIVGYIKYYKMVEN